MKVELDRVPLRDASLSPEEILMSESQERMCAIVEPKHIDRFLEICKKWDVTVTVIGEVTDGDRLEITWHGDLIVDVPPRTVAHEGPVYNRPLAKPDYIDRVNAEVIDVALPSTAEEIKAAV
jgi:phosphoribosylformylglycinamidine synthase